MDELRCRTHTEMPSQCSYFSIQHTRSFCVRREEIDDEEYLQLIVKGTPKRDENIGEDFKRTERGEYYPVHHPEMFRESFE